MTTEPTPTPESPQQQASPSRKRGVRALQAIVGFISVIFVVLSIAHDKTAITQALSASGEDIACVLALLIAYFVLYSYRFVLLIDKHCGCRIGLLSWIRMLVVVRFMNNMVPQMGSVYRGITLKRDFGVSYTDYIAANIFFIWTDTLLNFVMASGLLWYFNTPLDLFGLPASVALGIGAVALLAGPLIAHLLLARSAHPSKIIKKLAQVSDNLIIGLRDARYMIAINIIAITSFLCMVGVFKILLTTVGAAVPFSTMAVFYALYRLTFHVNITPGNVGIREIAYGLLCAQANIGMAKGLLIAAELRVLSIVVLLIVGASVAGKEILSAWRLAKRGGIDALRETA